MAQDHPNIRLMTVDRLISGTPKREFPVRREWRPLTAAETNRFSSVGLFFGTHLDKHLGGKVPLGLVHVNWGGTIVEAWFGADELLRSNVGTARMRAAVKSAAERGAKWEKDPFRPQIPVLRELTKKPQFRESFFVGFGAPVKRLSWTDDAGWANLANSMAVLSWLAKEGGVRGQWCDHEDYYGQKQFTHGVSFMFDSGLAPSISPGFTQILISLSYSLSFFASSTH